MKKVNSKDKKRKAILKIAKGRSAPALSHSILGRTSDGIVIYEPKLPPQAFTRSELRRAVRAVKAERALQAS